MEYDLRVHTDQKLRDFLDFVLKMENKDTHNSKNKHNKTRSTSERWRTSPKYIANNSTIIQNQFQSFKANIKDCIKLKCFGYIIKDVSDKQII